MTGSGDHAIEQDSQLSGVHRGDGDCSFSISSIARNEAFDAEYRTPFLIATAVLIPLTVFISIRLWRKPN